MTSGGAPAERRCTHCALPLPVWSRAKPAEGGECFCCSGCFLAHRLGHKSLEGRTDRLLARVILSAFLAMGVMVFSLSLYGELLGADGAEPGEAAQALAGIFRLGAMALSTPVFVLLGLPLFDAVCKLGRWLSADALVLCGVTAAWLASAWNTFNGGGEVWFDTATAVLVLFSLGRWLDARARERATAELLRIAPQRQAAAVRIEGDREVSVVPGALGVGDVIRVRPGETVPVDGHVLRGRSFVDTAALTGEEQPRSFGVGDGVLAGTRLVDGSLEVRVEATEGRRLLDEIERLLREAVGKRAGWVRLADRVAGALLPVALTLAAVTLVLRWSSGPEQALLCALSVVLIACPCALGIATPLAFWAAIGSCWSDGVLVHSGEVLERLARARRVFFDKTGTLTSGALELGRVRAREGTEPGEVLRIATALEIASEHPIARCLREAYPRLEPERELPPVDDFRALPGSGVEGTLDGVRYCLRKPDSGVTIEDTASTTVVLARAGEVIGELEFTSTPRPEARDVIERLRGRGLELRVLTGDGPGPARALERRLGVPVEADLSPADKVARIRAAGAGTVFVGDGLNDAAAIASADVGVSMASGSARALDVAQVNLLSPGLEALPRTIERARVAVRTARVNLAWAFGYNAVGLGLAASGRLTPVFAASAMVLSSLAVVLHSSRLFPRRQAGPGASSDAATTVELRPTLLNT